MDEFSPECDCPGPGGACLQHAVEQYAAEVERLEAIEQRVRTTATRPQGHGERTADYRERVRLARYFLGEDS